MAYYDNLRLYSGWRADILSPDRWGADGYKNIAFRGNIFAVFLLYNDFSCAQQVFKLSSRNDKARSNDVAIEPA